MVQDLTKEDIRKMKTDHGEVIVGEGEEEDDDLVLPGYRFHPTDEELLTFYLRRKVAGKRLSIEIIKEMDIYKHEPWDFPKANTVGGDKEWYFFCMRGRKYKNSIRPNRVTGSGFWKATGIDRPIYSAARPAADCIGLKKSLVYYRGSAGKGTKTEWMMHEFRLPPRPDEAVHSSPCLQDAEVWTLCRVFRRNITYKKQPRQVAQQPDSSSVTGSLESDCTGDEYMNSLAPQTPPTNNGYGSQQFPGQWNGAVLPAAVQPSPATAEFHPSFLSPPTPNDVCWDDIGRMVMELTDPSVFYDLAG